MGEERERWRTVHVRMRTGTVCVLFLFSRREMARSKVALHRPLPRAPPPNPLGAHNRGRAQRRVERVLVPTRRSGEEAGAVLAFAFALALALAFALPAPSSLLPFLLHPVEASEAVQTPRELRRKVVCQRCSVLDAVVVENAEQGGILVLTLRRCF